LKGKVIKIVPGAVNSEITIEMYGGPQIISVIKNTSVQNLGLKRKAKKPARSLRPPV
jgi:molybdopterin-binding protein